LEKHTVLRREREIVQRYTLLLTGIPYSAFSKRTPWKLMTEGERESERESEYINAHELAL
jgi:hypothetical protein